MNFNKLTDHLKLDKQEFLFQFNSHPNYPSALAFSDTLNFLNVKNDVYELEKEYWGELPNEFISITDEKFSLIKKENNQYKGYSDDEKQYSKENLYKNSKDIVILFEKMEEENSSSAKIDYTVILYVIFGLIMLYSLLMQYWIYALYNFVSTVGIYISLELFKEKFGQESIALNNICGSNSSAGGNSSSCSKIIDSDKMNLLGLKLSDFSLIYFLSILLIGLFLPATGFILKTISIISLLVIAYSLYIQIIVEKVICKICLIIISLLIIQLLLSIYQFNFHFTISALLLSIIAFAVILFTIIFINDSLKDREILNESNLKNLRFKRTFDIFKKELVQNGRINFKDDKAGFLLGNEDAKIHISLVSNPYCGFCKEAHSILEKILKKYPETISAQVRFNHFPEKADVEANHLMTILANSYSKCQNEFLKALHFWLENRDFKIFNGKFLKYSNNTNLSYLSQISEDNFTNKLTFTPVFLINGYQFPDKYDREDIFYFLDELLEDEEIVK